MDQYNIISLIAGVLYAMSGILIKRVTDKGTGVTRIMFVTRWLIVLLVIPIFLKDPEIKDMSAIWSAVKSGFLIFFGWFFALIGMRMGEISIQMPLSSIKVLFIAIFSILIYNEVFTENIWLGIIFTFVGILIMGFPNLLKKNISKSAVFFALASSILFALTDVIICEDAVKLGEGFFILINSIVVATLSLFFIPFFRKPINQSSPFTIRWGLSGALFLAIEEISVIYALSYSGDPTMVNTLCNSKAIWAIVLVWAIGHRFGIKDKEAGAKVMICRLIGSILLTVAILFILWG